MTNKTDRIIKSFLETERDNPYADTVKAVFNYQAGIALGLKIGKYISEEEYKIITNHLYKRFFKMSYESEGFFSKKISKTRVEFRYTKELGLDLGEVNYNIGDKNGEV